MSKIYLSASEMKGVVQYADELAFIASEPGTILTPEEFYNELSELDTWSTLHTIIDNNTHDQTIWKHIRGQCDVQMVGVGESA